ncbi:hypothetical protein EJ06DRAFT_511880 [Trichodelitschia bisporula]|uniref:Methyltransferase type 11 domain-containing protein n=1 Tax=Trichodelitschia bisporula TaxID=703511 RepID=A0A6G1HUE4_9PEZI|nr:hypothetical protein EJ06DRAFT_511880 [Trichodelitschia bisporula]
MAYAQPPSHSHNIAQPSTSRLDHSSSSTAANSTSSSTSARLGSVPPVVSNHPSRSLPSSRLPSAARHVPAPSSTAPSAGAASSSSTKSSPSKLLKRRPVPTRAAEDSLPRRPTVTKLAPSPVVTRSRDQPSRAQPSLWEMQSNLPRAASASSKLPSTSRIVRFEPARTPSLVSGSSASTNSSPRSNLLRRKASNVGKQRSQPSPDSMSSHEDGAAGHDESGAAGYSDLYSDSVLGVSMPLPPTRAPFYFKDREDDVIQLDKYVTAHGGPLDDLPPPTPLYALSSTPSTGYSPGPFSISSTPTSMSSASPGIAASATSKSPSRIRVPFSRVGSDDASNAASARESSSSSASTIRAGDYNNSKARVLPLPAPPPSPPTAGKSASQSRRPTHHRHNSSSDSAGRRPSNTSSRHGPQSPPELAYLKDLSPRKQSLPLPSRRPTRPSREGTPDLSFPEVISTANVIQSNMSSLPAGPSTHRRQSSAESKRSAVSYSYIPTNLTVDTRTRFAMPVGKSRNPSPSPSQASSMLSPLSRSPTRGMTPDIPSDGETSLRVKPSPSTESKPFSSRFGFFSKKSKTVNAAPVPPQEKTLKRRKGPSAGTGHEGYGKFSAGRGRSGSTTSSDSALGLNISTNYGRGTSSRKSSVGSRGDSSADGSDVDDFFAERLAPVILRGTGPVDRKGSDDRSGGKKPVLLPSPMMDPSAAFAESMKSPPLPTDIAAPDHHKSRFGLSSLTSRRASRKSFMDDGMGTSTESLASTSMKPPYNRTRKLSISFSSHAHSSSDRSMTAPPESSTSDEASGPRRSETVPAPSKSQPNLKPPGKWSFFQRAKSPARGTVKAPSGAPVPVPAVTVPASRTTKAPPPRSVAHYAIGEPMGHVDADELARIMREAEAGNDTETDTEGPVMRSNHRRNVGSSSLPLSIIDTSGDEEEIEEDYKPRHGDSVLLPEPPQFPAEFAGPGRSASPRVALNVQRPEAQTSRVPDFPSPPVSQVRSPPPTAAPVQSKQPRPSRLAQVGRIPAVVSTLPVDREKKLSDASFSRPFAPEQPSPAMQSAPFRSQPESDNADSAAPPYSPITASLPVAQAEQRPWTPGTIEAPPSGSETVRGSPQELDSASTARDEYDGTTEFLAFPPRKDSANSMTSNSSSFFSVAAATAVIPKPGAPLGEDEIWNEYDDLLETFSDDTTPKPRKGSKTAVSTPSTDTDNAKVEPPPALVVPSVGSIAQRVRLPSWRTSGVPSPLLNGPTTPMPGSPMSISDFLSSYGDRGLSVVDPVTGRLSLPSTGRLSSSTTRLSLPARPVSGTSNDATPSRPSKRSSKRPQLPPLKGTTEPVMLSPRSDSSAIELAEQQQMGFASMANLRFGALMTSKWLSFGHVLFSPAHQELRNAKDDRMLIIDGLGKDWSYFAALNYPGASIYNLGSDDRAGPSSPNSGSPFPPPSNHRHVHHPHLAAPFPFPRGFFTAVVFRFPPASPESTFRAALSECKRVLRPGGFLEVCVLDMDLCGMGNVARRAVRALKVRMQAAEPGVALGPMSDTVLGLLGRRGFENLNRCILGMPAAGTLVSVRDGPGPGTGPDVPKEEGPSFSDLLRDQSGQGDEGIARMVARVGRWWYSRCYERAVLGATEASIWDDEAVLAECEERGTTLKLMLCFAQKPEVPVRRTISL